MSRNRSNSNSSDKERNAIEEYFKDCKVEDIPVPLKSIEMYEGEVLEVMNSGCNRQIAEYVIYLYKKLEDEEGGTKLKDLEEKYKSIKEKIIRATIEEIKEHYNSSGKKNKILIDDFKKKIANEENDDNDEHKEVIEEIKKNETIKVGFEERAKENEDSAETEVKFFYLSNKKKYFGTNGEDKKNWDAYIDKRDAVIEAALRKVKKIVNDEKEYEKFEEEYQKLQIAERTEKKK